MADGCEGETGDKFWCGDGGQPELGDMCGAHHEGVVEQSHGAQGPSHRAQDGCDENCSVSQPRNIWRMIRIQFNLK